VGYASVIGGVTFQVTDPAVLDRWRETVRALRAARLD
jgi:hypothetical protein